MTDNTEALASATLYANMAKVMGVLKTIPKNGRNKQQGYDFVTDSDLLDAIRPALAKHNVALVADMIEVAAGERPTRVLMRFRLCCGETGAVVESQWWGQSNMPGDKALTAAAVLAQKYFLKATFAVSTGDEGDDPDAHASVAPPQHETVDVSTSHESPRYIEVPPVVTPLQEAYTKAHGLFPGMDWKAFGAQVMDTHTSDHRRERALRLLVLNHPKGATIVSSQQQQELAYMVKSDLDASEGSNGNADVGTTARQAWEAAAAEVAAVRQQEAEPGNAAADAGGAGA